MQTLATVGPLGACLTGLAGRRASTTRAAGSEVESPKANGIHRAVEAEIRARARRQLDAARLVVDYYRVQRKLSYPLPLSSLIIPEVGVPSISVYPWATWLLWTLEERIFCLGWAAEWFEDEKARQAAVADLVALARWPNYSQYAKPDLSSAHAGRILWTASTRWPWVDEALRRSLREACVRHVEEVLPASDKMYGSIRTKDDALRRDAPHGLLHNIPLIGTVGAALTAAAAGHSAAARLNARVQALFQAVLDLRTAGHSEGVGYDGYVLDFVADWLAALPEPERSAVLDHPSLNHYLEQTYMLAAPGTVAQVAELSDVEPREMPFHLSAQAKLMRLKPHPTRSWLLRRCPPDALRSDGLAALRAAQKGTGLICAEHPSGRSGKSAPSPFSRGEPPPSGALDAHYAAVLRSGWGPEDLAVAVACSSSPMGHIQRDSGTLVIGTRGNWLVTDPGYQQYVRGEEREFTIGPTAHNAPVINGRGPSRKEPRRTVLESVGPGVHRVAVDLTACYPAAASVKTLIRNVWLSGKNLVVVADQVQAETPPTATYHWHADRAGAWWFEAGWALITLGGANLWLACSRARLSGADLHRLPGSRGRLSVISTVPDARPVTWWVFALAADRPALQADEAGRQIRVLDQTFRV